MTNDVTINTNKKKNKFENMNNDEIVLCLLCA